MTKTAMILSAMAQAAALTALVGCAGFSQYGKLEKTARGLHQVGKHDEAVEVAAQSLAIKANYPKSQEIVQAAFKRASEEHKDKLRGLDGSQAKFKWDEVVAEYERISKLNKTVRNLPPMIDKGTGQAISFEIADISQELSDAKEKAAAAHYQEGVTLAKTEGVDIQKKAAKEFKTAMGYVPGFKDSQDRYDKSRRAGVKRIAIIPFEDKTGKGSEFGALNDMIVDGLVSQVMNDEGAKEFLDIVSRDQLEQVLSEQKLMVSDIIDEKTMVKAGKILGVHEIVTGKLTQVALTEERTSQSTLKETNKVCDRKTVTYDSKGREREECIWDPVYASITVFHRTAGATISGSYKIVDIKTAGIRDSQAIKGAFSFGEKWARFSGDERALSPGTRALASREEAMSPAPAEMVNKAAENLTGTLSQAFKRYTR